jgi:hypothetical protein
MKTILRLLICMSILILSNQLCFSQEVEKTVTVTVSGSGKSQDEAKQNALRSAIEQTFGAFISSKTEILNDQVVADQIASVSSGNIQSFTMLNESQLPDGSWGVTLKAIVSVSKLTSFVEAKGVAVEIKGGLFALNIKQQSLNELGEVKAITEMVGLLHETMQISFDYTIKPGEPKSLDAENKNWEIPLEVTAIANKNMDLCANYFIKTLSVLSLSTDEVASYASLNKTVFTLIVSYNGVAKTFYLRKEGSINAINTLTNNWELYTRLFTVHSGLDESNGNGEGQIHVFSDRYDRSDDRYLNKTIKFLTIGQKAGTFSWLDKRTLSQIENMTGYKIKPRGVVSQFKHGGFVVYERNGHGLVEANMDIGVMDLNEAKLACKNLELNGYNDWRLPTQEELNVLYLNFKQTGFGGFNKEYPGYWSSKENSDSSQICCAFIQFFRDGVQTYTYKYGQTHRSRVRTVRTF